MQKAGQHDPSGYFLIEVCTYSPSYNEMTISSLNLTKTSFLQDVFYTDLRDPSAIDLTRPILDWLQNSKEEAQKKWEYIINGELQQKQKAIVGEASVSHLPRFASFEMQKIHFCDLGFRLGAGYLYCHQVHSFICHRFIVLLLPLDFPFFKFFALSLALLMKFVSW